MRKINTTWREKWNYGVEFLTPVEDITRKRFEVANINNVFNIQSLPWTKFETSLIEKLLLTRQRLFIQNNLSPIKVHKHQIIIIDDKTYDEIVKIKDGEGGKCQYGYIYVRRNEYICKFISDLTHELSHLDSLYVLSIKEKSLGRERTINQYKLGYCIQNDPAKDEYQYQGLNEAVTEMWSKIMINEVFGRYPRLISGKNMEETLNCFSYPYHVALLENLVFNLPKNDSLAQALFKSYFDGSSDFFDLLEKEIKGAKLILEKMDATDESVFEAAQSIGGEELKTKISSISLTKT